ncbi:hypothetical protein EROM_091130 [Encephalitozoon romaleae SJ-2008]|uniref:Uncharacterized protein n=1 Tax=Encephalitozoon romaleae (strain SJ-2008) TaxID=1178016 RepID=I7APG8_ENCRO|nr:hypothetical protein EROM_091130 [Encephalitozoon romaleae SJ-2008]AFN83729.1 hypothetical protein EROM_091130 [Encephalitozoon romaleae SJ-2008]
MVLGSIAIQFIHVVLAAMILSLDFLFLLFTIQRSLYFFGKSMKRRPESMRVRLMSGCRSELYLIDCMSCTDLIYLPGNFVAIEEHIEFCKYLSKMLECNVISMVYRGIAGNCCSPSERGIIEDLSPISQWISRRSTRKVVLGFSIGSAVGVRLAEKCHVDALVLVNPFISLREVVSNILFGRVLKHFIVDEWNNVSRMKEINAPVYFVVSSNDEIVPPSHTDELIKKTRLPRMIVIPGADHNEPMRNFATHLYPVIGEILKEKNH